MLQKEILKQFLMMKAGINNAYTVLFLIGILLFYIDTAIGLLIPMHIGKFELVFVPHLTFMYILMMVVYRGFGVSLLLSIFLGVMTDVYFGSIYGVYLFGYILFLALIDRFFKIFLQRSFDVIHYYISQHLIIRSLCGINIRYVRIHSI